MSSNRKLKIDFQYMANTVARIYIFPIFLCVFEGGAHSPQSQQNSVSVVPQSDDTIPEMASKVYTL